MSHQTTLYTDPSHLAQRPNDCTHHDDPTCTLIAHSPSPSLESQDTLVDSSPLKQVTPLPVAQLACLCVCRLADPIMFTQILPYVNQMMTDLHVTDDPSRIGFYSGLVESSFAVAQLFSIYHWAALSDVVGRRPVIFLGITGMAIGSLFFGLSRTLAGVMLARCLSGLFSGNVAVIHSVLGELTDSTNQAIAFPIYGLTWPLGSIIGPLIGGTFSNPAKQFPALFDYPFFRTYPYFLPGFIASILAIAGVLSGYFFLEETLPSKRRDLSKSSTSAYDADKPASKPTLRELFSIPIIRALSISGSALSFISTAFDVLFVLFCYTPIESGGLAFSAAEIGFSLAMAGVISVFIQIFVTPVLLRRVDHVKVYNTCMGLWPFCFALLPLLNVLARAGCSPAGPHGALNLSQADVRVQAMMWCCIATLLGLTKLACLGYAVSMILVKENAPGPASLGATNGLVQFCMSFSRSFCPAFVSSIFAMTLDYHLLGGYFWSVVMVCIALLGTRMARRIEEHRCDKSGETRGCEPALLLGVELVRR
ncbi:MFS general substrate transporter [Amylostereum chailletii]|nr:MFS general substrate transporter [Amylostereum chailletii]